MSGLKEEAEGEVGSTQFEQRTRALLLESAERLPGSVRSRLTQARYAALAARTSKGSTSGVRRWMPAGAVAGVVLALFIVFVPHGTRPASPAWEDVEMLSDSDAVPLNGDQDVDYDFYEWAANEASGAPTSPIGS
jgi:hypothetical protein